MSRQNPDAPDTILAHAGRHPDDQHGMVNPPVYHASTVLFPSVAALEAAQQPGYQGYRYGRLGTPTSRALEEAAARLESAAGAVLAPSGLGAISLALLAAVRAGDHVLVTDSVYGPTRSFCAQMLARLDVETEFYDPAIGAGIADRMRPNTRAVFVESPGSLTFEVQDVPAIARAAKAAGALVLMDNTWATPLYFRPFEHGVDIAIQAATKYVVGHSDAMLGIVTCTADTLPLVRDAATLMGVAAGPDDIYLGLRGLRTMGVRLARHYETGLALGRWLAARPEVERVLHPALPGAPGHDLWQRDFTGASGLFSVVLKPVAKPAICAMIDHMDLFGMGYSWGGFESLILLTHPEQARTATHWDTSRPTIRLHAGLEDPDDLIRDLERGFDRMAKARTA